MTPKHINPVPRDRRAIAPYNFVELPDDVVPAQKPSPKHDGYYSEHQIDDEKIIKLQTGRVECTLTTESPLYTRCGLTSSDFGEFGEKTNEELTDEQRQKRAAFFNNPANQHPTIPGSSLRGMLRTLVEIVGYGKLDLVSDLQPIYRAVADTTSLGDKYRDRLLKTEPGHGEHSYSFLMQAGYLIQRNFQWEICPAQDISEGASFARIEESQIKQLLKRRWNHNIQNAYKVSVYVEPLAWHDCRNGYIKLYYAKAYASGNYSRRREGVLVITGRIPGKKMECVLGMPDNNAITIPIPDEIIQDYKNQVTKEQKALLGEDGALQHNQPIFYLIEDGKLVFFGHTMMFRLPYENSVTDFIPNQLRNPDTIDLAEAIFGFVRSDKREKDQVRAGRVFVSDAICQQTADKNIWLTGDSNKTVTPQILGSPKPTTFQHYLVQSSAEKPELKNYASQPSEETVIRGHKLYWHKGKLGKSQIEDNNPEENACKSQYTTIKPLKEGISFKFTIRFENLSDVELGALLWILSIAADNKYRLSLGMGKPLGMGAIKISHELWLSDRKQRYTHLFQNNDWETGDRPDSANEVKQRCLRAFEDYILEHANQQNKYQQLKYVPRIKTLLTMLSWHGPLSRLTRYMEIERQVNQPHIGNPTRFDDETVNEYKERPVLPTPLQVMEDDQNENYPDSSLPPGRSSSNPAARQRNPQRPNSQSGGSGSNPALQKGPRPNSR